MGRTFDIEIDAKGIPGLIDALKDGMREGLDDAGDTLLDNGEDHAKDIVMSAPDRRVWNKDVKRGFTSSKERMSRPYHWQGNINNPVYHARIVNEGYYPGKAPPLQEIIGWVDDNLSPSDINDTGSPGSSGGGAGGDQPSAITSDDYTVNYTSLDDFKLRADSFESDRVRAGNLGDGTGVIWKSHNDGIADADWKRGIIANEVVWSRAAEMRGVDIGPKSRIESVQLNSGAMQDGTLQEFVEGSQLADVMYKGYGDPDNYDLKRDQFLEDNLDWAANTNAIDYLIGNDDRHANNVRVNPDGEPRTIDSGGNQFNEDLRGRDLHLMSDLLDYDTAVDPDNLYEQNQRFLDRTEEIIEEVINDEEYRQSLINTVKGIHGEGSKEHDRILKILGDEVGPGHILSTDDEGKPLYKLHIDSRRRKHERTFNGGDQFNRDEDIVNLDSDDDGEEDLEPISAEEAEEHDLGIEETLNGMFGNDDNEE